MNRILFFLVALILFANFAVAAPVTDLNLTLMNPPAVVTKDLNVRVTWVGSGVSNIYWRFDSDGNVLDTDRNVILSDNFDHNVFSTAPIWTNVSGTWVSGSTVGNTLRVSGSSGMISTPLDYNLASGTFDWNFTINPRTRAASNFIIVAGGGTTYNLNTEKTYNILVATNGTPTLRFGDGAGNQATIVAGSAGDVAADANTVIRVQRLADGNWNLIINGVSKGTAIETSTTDMNAFWLDFREASVYLDDLNVVTNFPITSPKYHTHNFSTSGAKVISVTVQNADGNTSAHMNLTLALDSNAPVIVRKDINAYVGFGITGQLNYTLQCTDDISTTLVYNILNNDVNQYYSASDANNSIVYDQNNVLNNGDNVIKFRCVDQAGNVTQDQNTFSGYSANFYFVWDGNGTSLASGADYTAADINEVKVYSQNLQTYRDLFALGQVSVSYSGVADDSLEFRINYTDPQTFPSITRKFEISLLDTNNIPVCISKLQPFYQQLIYSSTVTDLILKNAYTGCYIFNAGTRDAYLDNKAISGYTIPQAYNLYRFVDGNKSLIALIDGGASATINIDLLILKEDQNVSVKVVQDVLSVGKYCTSFASQDCNTMKVRYFNYLNENESVVFKILNGSTLLYTVTEDGTPNNALFYFDISTLNVGDANLLILQAIITRTNGDVETITRYFTPQGSSGTVYPWVAILLSVLFFMGGITLVAARFALGWFGILIALAALAFLSLSAAVWQVTFMQSIMLVALVYIGLITKDETARMT